MKKIGIFCFFFAFMISGCSKKNSIEEPKITIEDLSSYFTDYDGCFVLYNQNQNEYIIYNEAKSKIQVSPCSTFKVVNALIGLEAEVIKDENTTFQWDGTDYQNKTWNKDQTLASAITDSAFWYFQKSASEVGEEKIQGYLEEVDYGNKDISGGITEFWEQSSLKISPREQVELLKRFYSYKMPFSKINIDLVKKMIVLSSENEIILSGKTGSGLAESGRFIPQGPNDNYVRGWFIGYIEDGENMYYFATMIEGSRNAYGGKAKEITLDILRDKSIYK